MPSYNYKCNECGEVFVVIHSISQKHDKCNTCYSTNIEKTISLFAAKTENTLDHAFRSYETQFKKDIERFQKDDTFAANVTGFDDPNSVARMNKILTEQKQKQSESLKKFKGKKNE